MSSLLKPFTGYVPTSEFASRVVGPPTAMLSKEQRRAARRDPLSFRYAAGRGAGNPHEYAVAWVEKLRDQGVLRPVGPAVFVYRQSERNFAATGIIGDVSLRAYDAALVRRHEAIFAKTEQDMADYIRSTRILGNPVVLAHGPRHAVSDTVAVRTSRPADTSFTSVDGVFHELWAVEGDGAEELCEQIDHPLYVIDGHHRLAGASIVAREERRTDASIPAGIFTTSELRLRSFARCIFAPELDADRIVDRLRSDHVLEEVSAAEARPRSRSEFGMRIGQRYFRLRIDDSRLPDDPDRLLPVNLLHDIILGPVFGIDESGTGDEVLLVADLRDGIQPDSVADAWLLPFPTTVGDVIAVADRGGVMPQKSTWFAPKLPSGLVIRMVDPA